MLDGITKSQMNRNNNGSEYNDKKRQCQMEKQNDI